MSTGTLLTVDAARQAMLDDLRQMPFEEVRLEAAHGRTLASPIIAPRDQPPLAISAMDGYAVRAVDLAHASGPEAPGGEWTGSAGPMLAIVDAIAAGSRPSKQLGVGEVARVLTGAPVPLGADLVIPQERVTRVGDQLRLNAAPGASRNIRAAGSDFPRGACLVSAGTRLTAAHIGLIAATGCDRLSTLRRPVVAILATGNEIVQPGNAASGAQIFDSVGFALAALIQRWGAIPRRSAALPDELATISAAIASQAEDADALVFIGGASVGDFDFTKQAVAGHDFQLKVDRIAVRPGKPTWFGLLGERPVLGLPGNPVAALVCAHLFLRPILARLLAQETVLPLLAARLSNALGAGGEFETYTRAVCRIDQAAQLAAAPLENQDTASLSAFAAANALIRRIPHCEAVRAGELVDVLPLEHFATIAGC